MVVGALPCERPMLRLMMRQMARVSGEEVLYVVAVLRLRLE